MQGTFTRFAIDYSRYVAVNRYIHKNRREILYNVHIQVAKIMYKEKSLPFYELRATYMHIHIR